MKLKFDSNLEYQEHAVSSIVDLFRGQLPKQANFTVSQGLGQIGMYDSKNGIGNRIDIDEEDILKNLQEVQLRNGLPQTKKLTKGKYEFDVEMETGTGKTYVYLRTIMELNKNYGFLKFIIVVPSIAIKEGVYKSLQITQDHFKGLYDGVVYNYFYYDSSKLEQVRSFAVSDNIEIMVINIDAFRKSFEDTTKESKANIIHRENDRLNGMKPIELIQETNPIVIIDEPQSVDNTPKAKDAIAKLNPMCTFRYSATHREKHDLVYRLDAVDSFELGLVKQIEVAGFETANNHNKAYMKLISVDNKRGQISAKMEIDKKGDKGKVSRKTVTVKQGDDLFEKSGSRDLYEGYIVNEINCEEGKEFLDFTSKPDVLRLNESTGEVDDIVIKEQQIRKTIEEHLDKELYLNKQGIKVLSLFFIDKVSNYRTYDKDGNAGKGIYAELFERHYGELIRKSKYNTLFKDIDLDTLPAEVHGGYFSIDKSNKYKDTKENSSSNEDVFNLIMRDKEKLLSFDTKLRFIFSHTALREGWDNPNVFQICTLNETKSEIKKRQEIGRGLRICVDQNGERHHGSTFNTLTVMANESYQSFAQSLQKEYEEEQGIKFGIIEAHTFANIPIKKEDGSFEYFGAEKSETLFKHMVENGYIEDNGTATDKLIKAIDQNKLEVPDVYKPQINEIVAVTKKAIKGLRIKNNNDKVKVELNKKVYLDDEFRELWDRIKQKTTYSLTFDSNELIENCSRWISKNVSVQTPKIIYTVGKLGIDAGGVTTTEKDRQGVTIENQVNILPDIISYLQNETDLTRATIVKILLESKTLHQFKKNPQSYMEQVSEIIKTEMRKLLIHGIKYTKVGDSEYYAQELFESEELTGYLEKNMIKSEKSVFEYVVYDSGVEEAFAKNFETNRRVKLYAKLPDWFKVPTPLGSYNPDWAVLVDKDGEDKLYFVLETKGNAMFDALRPSEYEKIKCGEKHFEALGEDVKFEVADSFEKFIEM